MAKLRITLKRSLIGRKKDQIATVHTLGLKKINDTVERDENPQLKGMITKVNFLLEVEEI